MKRQRYPRSYDEQIYDGLTKRVEVWDGDRLREIVAACCNSEAAVAAFEAMIPRRQGFRLVLRWGGHVMRDTGPSGDTPSAGRPNDPERPSE